MKSGYNIYHIVYVFILLDFMVLRAIDIKYVSKIFPPDSILENKEDYKPLSVYGRQRYATTTGVTFLFDDNYLATVSLLGNILSLYKFDKQSGKVSFLKKLSNHSALEIFNSENLVVSYDNKLLAIAGCPPSPGINLYKISTNNNEIFLGKPILKLNPTKSNIRPDSIVHSIRFTRDDKFLCCATFHDKNSLVIYKINKSGDKYLATCNFVKPNPFQGLVSKCINFTKDNKFIVVCYAKKVGIDVHLKKYNKLIVFEFDSVGGRIGKKVCVLENLPDIKYPEDCQFLDNDNYLIISSQGDNALVAYPFNKLTGRISSNPKLIKNPNARLSFPHGIGLSSDGKWLVAANYGDDSFNLYSCS